MSVGDWFRQFGQSSSEHYFEVVHQDDDGRVTIHHFRYVPVKGSVQGPSEHALSEKEWLQLVAENEIVPVPRDSVPFLMVL
tara:strand:+ start:569 stop:811 length:243 start_codon:yes stop_codon:yes gene_type:complete